MAYLLPNIPEMLVAHFAVPLAGAVLVAINTRLSTEEVRYILDHSGAKLLVVDAALHPIVAPVAGELKTVEEIITVVDPARPGDGTGSGVTYDDLLARGTDEPLPWTVEDETATISINYTSGTTGKPKGVMYPHRGAYLNSFAEIIHSGHSRDSVYLWTLPMFHCNGWCTPWAVTAIGGTHVCLREVAATVIWELSGARGGHPPQRRPDRASPRSCPARRGTPLDASSWSPRPARRRARRRSCDGADRLPGRARLRPHRDLRAVLCEPVPATAGTTWTAEERRKLLARQGVGMVFADGSGWSTRR